MAVSRVLYTGASGGSSGGGTTSAMIDNADGTHTHSNGNGTNVVIHTAEEVVESLVALAGAAPAYAKWGINTTTGDVYYVNGGTWTAFSGGTGMSVSDESGTPAPVAPLSAPGTAESGAVHVERYSDFVVWWVYNGTVWVNTTSAPIGSALTDSLLAFVAGNVDLTIGNHDRVDATSAAVAMDTVTIPAFAAIGDVIEFYNASGVELALAKQAGDSYLGAPSLVIPDGALVSIRAVDANVWEVSGTGETSNDSYSETFVVGSWTGPAGGFYTYTVLGLTHGLGTDFSIQAQEDTGAAYQSALFDSASIDKVTGDLTILVSDVPDSRFDGRVQLRKTEPPSGYVQAFNATTDWVLGAGEYTFTLLGATHLLGSGIELLTQEDTGTDYVSVQAQSTVVNKATGDVTISVSDAPDARFAGRILVSRIG